MTVIKNEKLRNVLRYAIPFGLIPATVALSATAFGYFESAAVMRPSSCPQRDGPWHVFFGGGC